MTQPGEDVRELQAIVYGRDGGATAEQIERLASLQKSTTTRDDRVSQPEAGRGSFANESTTPGAQIDASRRGLSRRFWAAIFGTLGITLVLGIIAGLGIATAMPPAPMAGVVPPDASIYRSDSVTFFGETDGVRVWTGTLLEDPQHCLIAMSSDGTGAINCVPSTERTTSVDLLWGQGGRVRTVSIDFFDTEARPQLSTKRG